MSATHPTLSIIVPVYNSEKYLCNCLDSIAEQSFRDFELILIDDGSADNSGTICDNYAMNDGRISYTQRKRRRILGTQLRNSIRFWQIHKLC